MLGESAAATKPIKFYVFGLGLLLLGCGVAACLPLLFSLAPHPSARFVPPAKKGLTWGKVTHDSALGIDFVGCHGQPRVSGNSTGSCDPYEGDTSCTVALPILCLKPENLPRPNYAITGSAGGLPAEGYNGWTGGQIGLTEPVRGSDLTSAATGDAMCTAALGSGYQMAEHHDGKYIVGMGETTYYAQTWPPASQLSTGGWSWYAYGSLPENSRFWVKINGQPANCWDPAPTP